MKNEKANPFWADLSAGFVVFLLALPLSIGIALASSFPASAGLIAAAVGGLIVAPLAGSEMTIKGPAAGMIVIMIGAVEELGHGDMMLGAKFALSAVVVAGLIQIVLGLAKFGRYSSVFPEAAVKGMLAAIGIIIISKQSHLLLGVTPSAKTPMSLLAEIPQSMQHANPYIAAIGAASLLLMFAWPSLIQSKIMSWAKPIPPAVLVVALAIGCSLSLNLSTPRTYQFMGVDHAITKSMLVSIPNHISSMFMFPDFSAVGSAVWFKWLFLIAAVSSLESMLTVKAIYGLDPRRRRADQNRDLIALGAGNLTSGLLGGLPMIAEVVRSSANLNAGAESRWSNFFHGLFLALCVGFFGFTLQLIPIAALSGMLVFTGYRLIAPERWGKIFAAGKEQFFVFLLTMVMTVATDLLTGIALGVLCEVLFNLFLAGTVKGMIRPQMSVRRFDGSERTPESNFGRSSALEIHVKSPLTFMNLLATVEGVERSRASNVVVNVSHSPYIDHTSMHALSELAEKLEKSGRRLTLQGLESFRQYSDHPLSARRNSFDVTIVEAGRTA